MWWDKFDIRMSNKLEIFNKDVGRQVHTDELKLRLLNNNICDKFITVIKATIDMQMSVTPMIMTYYYPIANYRNTVNQRFPNAYPVKRNNRRIQTTSSSGVRGGRGGLGGQFRGTVRRNDDC